MLEPLVIACEREHVSESYLDERLAARSASGWRLVTAVQHNFQTEEETPIWIVFWERTI